MPKHLKISCCIDNCGSDDKLVGGSGKYRRGEEAGGWQCGWGRAGQGRDKTQVTSTDEGWDRGGEVRVVLKAPPSLAWHTSRTMPLHLFLLRKVWQHQAMFRLLNFDLTKFYCNYIFIISFYTLLRITFLPDTSWYTLPQQGRHTSRGAFKATPLLLLPWTEQTKE